MRGSPRSARRPPPPGPGRAPGRAPPPPPAGPPGRAEARRGPGAVATARPVVRRAGERLGHGLEATVVALAGPTGAGKSTLFNELAQAGLVPAGRRPPAQAP